MLSKLPRITDDFGQLFELMAELTASLVLTAFTVTARSKVLAAVLVEEVLVVAEAKGLKAAATCLTAVVAAPMVVAAMEVKVLRVLTMVKAMGTLSLPREAKTRANQVQLQAEVTELQAAVVEVLVLAVAVAVLVMAEAVKVP